MIALIRKKRKAKQEKPAKPCHHQSQTQNTNQLEAAIKQPEATPNETTASPETPPNDPPSKEQPQVITEKDCTRCKQEKHDRRVYRWKLILGLLIPYTLASLDLTIVASASSFVASHFGRTNQLSWIATAYTLTYAAFIPTFGQFADIFGRHSALQLAMLLMLIGSVLCAAAQVWAMFLLGRAIQGTGAAGIMNLIKIVLSDKVSLAQNSKNTTIFSFVGGIAFGVGPVIGGYLTNASWRYCFVLPIPLCVIASVIMFFLLRKELVQGPTRMVSLVHKPSEFFSGCKSIDVGGTVLFIFGVALIILATAWGGATYPWSSTAVLVPLVVGPILFGGFFVWEYLLEPGHLLNRKFPRQIPLIPWGLFKRPDAFLLCVINFATGTAMYSIFYYMSVYFSLAKGFAPSVGGSYLVIYLGGTGLGVYFAMFFCNVWPRQTFYPIWFGSIIEAAAIGLLTWAVTTKHLPFVLGMMALASFGTGIRLMPNSLHGVGVWPTKISSILSLMAFAQPFGGTLGLSIVGSVFNNKAPFGVISHTRPAGAPGDHRINLPMELKDQAATAVMWGFVAMLPIMGLCVLAASALGNVWIKKQEDGSSTIIYSSYLIALLTGTIRSKQVSNIEPSELVQDNS